jgi:hypothetical protein
MSATVETFPTPGHARRREPVVDACRHAVSLSNEARMLKFGVKREPLHALSIAAEVGLVLGLAGVWIAGRTKPRR